MIRSVVPLLLGYGGTQLASLLALGCNRSVCLGAGLCAVIGWRKPAAWLTLTSFSPNARKKEGRRGEMENGGPCWIRTSDQLVKSQLLYQLS